MKKVANILLTIFSLGVLFAVIAGGISVIGYGIAIIVEMCIRDRLLSVKRLEVKISYLVQSS